MVKKTEIQNIQTDFPKLLFETSWEVCNKVGGIYTVLSTKAKELKKIYSDRLIFIGPDIWSDQTPSPTFIERKTLLNRASSKLSLPRNISIRTGRWDIPGSPLVVLVKFQHLIGNINDVYAEMWENFKVDSLHGYGDYDEACAFSIASAEVIKALSGHLGVAGQDTLAHFNEWTTGMGLLWLRLRSPQTATVFTTHATSIGRSICGNGKPLYDYFHGYHGNQMAEELNMVSKHSLEKAAAHTADCFTAVSELTARECEQLLDMRPQVVTPNGFEPNFVPGEHSYKRLREKGRERLLNIARNLTGKEYPEDTLILATSGRNEYRNKGLDMFLDSVNNLTASPAAKPVLAFILVPAWVKGPNNKSLGRTDISVSADAPDFITHRLNNEGDDSVFQRIFAIKRSSGSDNVIYVPCYLDGHDGIVNISYYDILPAIDLTVFASYYEPWGYTPLESIAFGVPTVTTDKSGFGQWILSHHEKGFATSGVEVVGRTDSNYDVAVNEISRIITSYSNKDASFQNVIKGKALLTSRKADWKFFISEYLKAFEIARQRATKR